MTLLRFICSTAFAVALGAALARHAFDVPPIGATAAALLQLPGIFLLAYLRYVARPREVANTPLMSKAPRALDEPGVPNASVVPDGLAAPDAPRAADRFLQPARLLPPLLIGAAALAIALIRGPIYGASMLTASLAAMLLLDAAAAVVSALIDPHTPLRNVMRISSLTWLALVLAGTLLLALPTATHPAVPDYGHNFWRHVSACAFTAAGAVSLNGATIYFLGDDLRPFGQAVAFGLAAMGYLLVLALGWRALRPWLSTPLIFPVALGVAMAAPLIATALSWSAWPRLTPDSAAPGWYGLSVLFSAAAQSGLSLRQDGIAPMIRDSSLFWWLLGLMIFGGVGPIVLLDRAWNLLRRGRAGDAGPRRELLSHELHLVLWILVIAAGCITVFESEGFLPPRLFGAQPLDLGPQQVTLREMPPAVGWRPGLRWRAALLMSASARSAGLHVAPLGPGAISAPTWLLLLLLMFVGGAVGSPAGGAGPGTLAAALMPARFRAAGAAHASAVARRILAGMFMLCVASVLLLGLSFPNGGWWAILLDGVSIPCGVGWGTGLAAHLSGPARIVMAALMFAGRMIPLWGWCRIAATLQTPAASPAPR